MSRSDEAARNREQFAQIFQALKEVREVFGDDCKLLCGVSSDGKQVGREPGPGYFDKLREKNGWQKIHPDRADW